MPAHFMKKKCITSFTTFLLLLLSTTLVNAQESACTVNNKIADKELYELLTTRYIPPNAYKSGNSWKCNSGYYRHKTVDYCYSLPTNAYALSSRGWACNSGYTKSDNNCIKYITKTNTKYKEEVIRTHNSSSSLLNKQPCSLLGLQRKLPYKNNPLSLILLVGYFFSQNDYKDCHIFDDTIVHDRYLYSQPPTFSWL